MMRRYMEYMTKRTVLAFCRSRLSSSPSTPIRIHQVAQYHTNTSTHSTSTKGHLAYATSAIIGTACIACNDICSTQMEYWDHDPSDFDIYIPKSEMTKEKLAYLLDKFDNEGLEVWPWIWTHPNDDGPHHVFIGISDRTLDQIEQLRNEECHEQNNILIIASQESLETLAAKRGDPDIYNRCQCGLVTDSRLELLDEEAKILMLEDERVISFDYLTIS